MGSCRTAWGSALLAGAVLAWPVAAQQPVRKPASASASAAQPRPVKLDYDMFTLPNGLTTIVRTDRSVPNVFVGLWYRIGSKDEPAGRTGFAHLFEHLMFQPTANSTTDYFAPLQKLGVTDINGSTTQDWTEYHQLVPTNALDTVLWMESDRMSHLTGGITQAVLDEQRGVVKNEKLSGEADGEGLLTERTLRNYFPPDHPYRHTTIGSMEDLDAASLADVKQWFEDYYGASNAVLVLSGDIDLATARAKVTRYFGAVRAGKPMDRLTQWVPDFPAVKRDVVYGGTPTVTLTRRWPLPSDDPRQTTLLQLVALTMTGRGGPLQAALVDEGKVALGVAATLSENQLTSDFSISVTLAPGVSVAAGRRAIDTALARYFERGPMPDRLAAVAIGTDQTLLRFLESNTGIGTRLATGYVDHGDPAFLLRQREWLAATNPDELKVVARRWLDRSAYEMEILPRPAPAPAQPDVDRTRPPQPGPFRGAIAFPPITRSVLPNGLTLVVARRPGQPIVDASLQFATGSLADRGYAPGAARQALGMLHLGSRQRDAAGFTDAAAAIGLTASSSVTERTSSFDWSVAADRIDPALALVAQTVRDPVYPAAAFGRATPRSATDTSTLFTRALRGGTKASDAPMTREAVMRFHDRELGPDAATLYLVGDVTPERAMALATRHFGDWRRATPAASAPVATGTGTVFPPRVILVDAPGAAQSSITVGRLTDPFDRDRAAADVLMNAAIGGSFESRLNTVLRQRKGWAYNYASSLATPPAGAGTFVAGGSVQADRTAESVAETRRLLTGFVTTAPETAEELERDRAALIHGIPAQFDGNRTFLASIASSASYGLPYDRGAGTADRLAAVTLDQVRDSARRAVRPEALTWLIVGDLSRIEAGIRALAIAPVEVWDATGKRVR